MTKCMKIDRCLDCKHFVSSDQYSYQSHCGKAKLPNGGTRYVEHPHYIPDWCPLPDSNAAEPDEIPGWLRNAIEQRIFELYEHVVDSGYAAHTVDALEWVLSLRRDQP